MTEKAFDLSQLVTAYFEILITEMLLVKITTNVNIDELIFFNACFPNIAHADYHTILIEKTKYSNVSQTPFFLVLN